MYCEIPWSESYILGLAETPRLVAFQRAHSRTIPPRGAHGMRCSVVRKCAYQYHCSIVSSSPMVDVLGVLASRLYTEYPAKRTKAFRSVLSKIQEVEVPLYVLWRDAFQIGKERAGGQRFEKAPN